MSEPMKNLSRLLLAPTLAVVLLLACTPTNAARRISGSPYDGTWSVAIYTLRGGCSSVRVATRIVGGRVYSEDQSYQANGAVGANGVIRVSVASGRLSASGSGRLSQNSGAGSWRSSECSGSWFLSRFEGDYVFARCKDDLAEWPRGCFVEGGGVGSEGDQSFAKRSPTLPV